VEGGKRVFIVASYQKDHVCGGPQEKGILRGINREGWFEGMNLEARRFYMDTKRKNTGPEAMKRLAKEALGLIDEFAPDVVVVVDDNAFREVGLALAGRPDLAVVFTGMNGQPEAYNAAQPFMETREKPGLNVTGVYESLYAARSLKVMQAAIPDLKGRKVVGITDYSPTGEALTTQFDLELGKLDGDVRWELKRVKDWAEYIRLIKTLNEDKEVGAIYPVGLSLRVSRKRTYTAPEIFEWTTENSRKPEMALNYYFSKLGLFGGAAVDFEAMGFLAGKKAGKILSGEKAGDIPIEDAPDYAIVFNLKRARKLGIEIPAPLLTAADHVYR
jgi:ABC transporter substrate binding protein